MSVSPKHWMKRLVELLAVERSEPGRHEQRIVTIQRHIVFPIRLLVSVLVFYFYFVSPWLLEAVTTYGVIFETIQNLFGGYALATMALAVVFYVVRRFPPGVVKWFVFALGLGDALFLGSLTVVTGGFESVLYWVYPGLIILNAISIPLEAPQVILNLLLSIFFLVAGLVETQFKQELTLESVPLGLGKNVSNPVLPTELGELSQFNARLTNADDPIARVTWSRMNATIKSRIHAFATNQVDEAELRSALVEELNRIGRPAKSVVISPTNPEALEVTPGLQVLRVAVLTLLTFSFYGVQVLLARQRAAHAEQQEFAIVTERLRTAGRVAAEFAHQLKNPLTIINNVVFSLQKAAPAALPKIEIIREEVAKCDRIITQIMGHGELSEGRLERLDVVRELESAIRAVFPPGLAADIEVRRNYGRHLPPLLMQRRHLADAVTNLVLNAREATAGPATIHVSASRLADDAVEISVRDEGPGIAPDKLERIFEAYYTTKPRGTGLGLAIVKHNVELYSGKVRVQSELGKGAEFILSFPGKMPPTEL